jgi:putative tributyrin esterase
MAIIQMNFMSGSIMQQTTVQAILPVNSALPPEKLQELKPLKTLYLLHGIFGDCNDWLMKTGIEHYAEKHHIAVIMPSGNNFFYVDNEVRNEYYGRYIGEELVAFTRKLFPLSSKREDTYIGGLSMGGYGAIRNGLKYSDNFSAIIGLSSALIHHTAPLADNEDTRFYKKRDYYESVFGDLDKLEASDRNPDKLILDIKKAGKEIPRIYMACGTEDELLEPGRIFSRFTREQGADITYEEGPGVHDWNFWDTYIQKALQWLLQDKSSL